MRFSATALSLLLTLAAPSPAATVILVRHAERSAAMTADALLTPQGEERARQLAAILKDSNIRAIFTTEVRRTQQTAEPTAREFHLTPIVIPQKDVDGLLSHLKALPDDETVLVVGHTDTVPVIVERLGGPASPMADNEYDRMVILTTRSGKPSILTLRYGEPPAPPLRAAVNPKPEDTEVWSPEPKVVTPGPTDAAPPSDAIVLFDGRNLDEWVQTNDKSPAKWTVSNGVLTVSKTRGIGNIETKRTFRNFQLHIEWRIPTGITGSGQARGNSGVFLASTGPGDAGYELQILDSYNNKTYVNGQAGSIYKQAAPLVNPNRKPGDWQTYDVVWNAPAFNADGALHTPAFATVFFNGVLVQNHFELTGETLYIGQPLYKRYDAAPIKLQAHGDASEPIGFRNIWVRELN